MTTKPRHRTIFHIPTSKVWHVGACLIGVSAWQQLAWLFDFHASILKIRGLLLSIAVVGLITHLSFLAFSKSVTRTLALTRMIVMLGTSSAPVLFHWIVPDISPDANSIHYPLALQIFTNVNLLDQQLGSWASERIDLGIGLHVWSAATMDLLGTRWHFEVVNAIGIALLVCSLFNFFLRMEVRWPLVSSFLTIASIPLFIQQFRLGYQDFFPSCIYFALTIEVLRMVLDPLPRSLENMMQTFVLALLATLGRTSFLALVLPLLIIVLWLFFASASNDRLGITTNRVSKLFLVSAGTALVFTVPLWPMIVNALDGGGPKLLRREVQQLYWSGAGDWVNETSIRNGIYLTMFGETSQNPSEPSYRDLLDLPLETEIADAGQPDARVAGAGPVVGEGYLVAILAVALALLLIRRQGQRRVRIVVGFCLLLAALALPLVLLPFNFNYRYFPNYSILLTVMLLGAWFIASAARQDGWRLLQRFIVTIGVCIVLFNSCLVALGALDQIRSDRTLVDDIRDALDYGERTFFAEGKVGLGRHFGLDLLRIYDPRTTGWSGSDTWNTRCAAERRVFQVSGENVGVCRAP